jgi:hypothetical protein
MAQHFIKFTVWKVFFLPHGKNVEMQDIRFKAASTKHLSIMTKSVEVQEIRLKTGKCSLRCQEAGL